MTPLWGDRSPTIGQCTEATPTVEPKWERRYRDAVVLNDILALLIATGVGSILGLGGSTLTNGGTFPPTLGLLVCLLAAACLFLTRAWDQRVLGQGSEELARLIRGFVSTVVIVGLSGLALKLPEVRPWVFGFIPLAGILAVLGRFALRKWLHRHRSRGRFVHPTLVVGSEESVAKLIERTRRDIYNGWTVTAACTPTGAGPNGSQHILGVPVVGDLDTVIEAARTRAFRVVAVCPTPGWAPPRLHRLSWDLDGLNTDLVVDPGLMEIAGPRLHVAPVDGFPMLQLTAPTFIGAPRFAKNVIDMIGAALLLAFLAPVMIGIALAVRLDGGPAFFQQERVGRHGRTFRILKFRTMVKNAEDLKEALVGQNDGAGPLFKMRTDPRVTRVGGFLRKYSLDETPQLFNVLLGTMSLVGPRPPLPSEVATYSREAQRRLKVRPGLTGLWQTSGRSDLSWEESVRLDLRYVENWSLAMDVLILWKTFGTVMRGRGAY